MSRVLPILFNTDMVRAILDGRKTVTRRICKDCDNFTIPDMSFYDPVRRTYAVHGYADLERKEQVFTAERPCPICPGDILYIRETWQECECGYLYRAWPKGIHQPGTYKGMPWRPSIHMPKDAARIWLKVTDVRVERLQAMGHDGPTKEGIHFCNCPDGFTWKPNTDMFNCYTDPMGAMRALWDFTIKKPDLPIYSWDANPWVWVIEFERCKKTENTVSKTGNFVSK